MPPRRNWEDDDVLDQDAMTALLGANPPEDAPVSTTMPVGGGPRPEAPEDTPAPPSRNDYGDAGVEAGVELSPRMPAPGATPAPPSRNDYGDAGVELSPKMPVAPPGAPTSNTMPVDTTAPVSAPTPAPAVTPRAAPAITPAGGFRWNQGHDFSAFDTQREQNPAKSAKDAFAMLANNAPPPPFHDKAALGAWFTQYIQPGMNELGHTVSSVDGDKFRFKNWQGEFDVDYGQNAGAAAGSMLQRLQWGAEAADDATRQMYAPGGSAPAYAPPRTPQPLAQGPGGPQQTPEPAPSDPAGGDPMAAIRAEIEALMQGGNSPMEQQALMRMLGAA